MEANNEKTKKTKRGEWGMKTTKWKYALGHTKWNITNTKYETNIWK